MADSMVPFRCTENTSALLPKGYRNLLLRHGKDCYDELAEPELQHAAVVTLAQKDQVGMAIHVSFAEICAHVVLLRNVLPSWTSYVLICKHVPTKSDHTD